MDILKEYVRTIVFYIILINLIEIIMPNPRYAKLIRLYLGLTLMYLIVKPIFIFKSGNLEYQKIIINYETYIEDNMQSIDMNNFEKDKKELIKEATKKIKEVEIKTLLESLTEYLIVNTSVILNEEEQIIEISLSIKNKTINNEIEPIVLIEIGEKNVTSMDVENNNILEIKNILSDVYNLSVENIYINIQKED